jgi:very-short-patch-repair endonuclease
MELSTLREVAVQVCHYFKDFLESDFKRQQAPRRRIILNSDSGFRCGMRIKPYDGLERDLWALLGRPSAEPLQLKLGPRKYTRSLSPVLHKIIEEQIAVIDPAAIHSTLRACKDHIDATYARSIEDPEKWVESVAEVVQSKVGEGIVRPLIARLDGPLQRSAYSVIDSLYAAEIDLIRTVAAELLAQLPDVLAKHLARRDDAAVSEALTTFLSLATAQEAFSTYFAAFVTADAFLEFRDLETYTTISEGVQMYLYIGSCRFRDVQYPLFFVPVQVDRLPDAQGYQLTLINQLFANRAAIDFVLHELAQAKMREWLSPIQDRINYLAGEQSIYEVARGLFAMVANAMDLAGQAELRSTASEASTADVTLSPSLHLCAFERGEEALVNDYEELIELARKGGGAIVKLFEDMVDGMLTRNPKSIATAVDTEWDALSLPERLVCDTPIPLNEEQRKILLAVRNPEGRIVVVEGPPGTGKSHTITAIAADCALNQRSCLVLSDKNEALEVVQAKLSEAMNRVRHDRDFPNPLLRLGRQDANFKKLVGNQTLNQISAYSKAMRANAPQLEAERKDTSDQLKLAIEQTVTSLGSISVKRLQEMHVREAALAKAMPTTQHWIQQRPDEPHRLHAAKAALAAAPALEAYLETVRKDGAFTAAALPARVKLDSVLADFAAGVSRTTMESLGLFDRLDADQVRQVGSLVLQYRQLRMPLFGYLFRGAGVRALDAQLNRLPAQRVLQLRTDGDRLESVVATASTLRSRLDAARLADRLAEGYQRLARRHVPDAAGVAAAGKALDALVNSQEVHSELLTAAASQWTVALAYCVDWQEVQAAFMRAPQFDYVGSKSKLERLNTSMMNSHVDNRLVDFMNDHRTDARTLAQLIAQRQKFPGEKFDSVRKSFPIIIASIREFGEYMPLVEELFDVVVIDEASQVSVAQALPAILRAKKVVVLGDSKQFANVKSSNASNAINDKYRSNLVQFFERNVKRDAESLQRLAMFDVKRSILEFCSMSASYSIMLRKHFRSYPELISLSSEHFYDRQLQAIKVRGVPVEDVIRFEQVDTAGKTATRTSNHAEAEFIAERLIELLDGDQPPRTVGVITPFREQHTLLTRQLFAHARGREFEDKLRLKVMTFDSCQGEERNIIFYSMVATPGNDALNYIFPLSLATARDSVEDKLKVQRLNVGFSRAQETIVFVHSMPVEQFRGSIGMAMNHYGQVLRRKHGDASQTDSSSPMEVRVLGWLQSTRFVLAQPEEVEILPQFPIGEYLRQLDPTYSHPSWRVDFLLTCKTDKGPLRIVVEYDGFEFHFQQNVDVHVGNHERYLKAEDVERQLTLESYGYRFLRINRFNLGSDPVATLDLRLAKLVEMATGEQTAHVVERLRQQAEGMMSKDMRQCTRCKDIKPLKSFFDQSLKDGAGSFGRVCIRCKNPVGGAVLRSRA